MKNLCRLEGEKIVKGGKTLCVLSLSDEVKCRTTIMVNDWREKQVESSHRYELL